jgi:hypothetical protein
MPSLSTDCSSCPVRDLGKEYAVKDPRDPWRRMPKLMNQLVATFGGSMYNRRSRTRRDTEQRITTYCARVRQTHGEPCSGQRQLVCASMIRHVAQVASGTAHCYPVFRAGLSSILDDDLIHDTLKATRGEIEDLDLGAVLREIEHVV